MALLEGTGCGAQPLAAVSAAMPSSKAGRQLNKQALAFLRRHVQPAPLPAPGSAAGATTSGMSACAAGATADGSGAPKVATLQQASLLHMLRCIGSSGAGAQLPERLPEPPLPDWAGGASERREVSSAYEHGASLLSSGVAALTRLHACVRLHTAAAGWPTAAVHA